MYCEIRGRRLYLETAGEGWPSVVLEAGAGSSSDTWEPIWDALSRVTRVCRYDRPNLGQSGTAASGLRNLHDVVDDLHAALTAAAIPGPYILVGHSFGGLVVRLFAHRHPSDVAGLVLIDSSHPEQYERSLPLLPPAGLAEARALTVISRSRPTTPDQLRRVRPGLPAETGFALEDLWQELQADLLRLTRENTHLIAGQSGHEIHREEPALVIDAICRMVERVRAGG